MAYPLHEEQLRAEGSVFSGDERPHLTTAQNDHKQEFNILEKLKYLRDDNKYTDVILDVKGTKLEAHKIVLAAWSPYFALKLFPDDPRVFKDCVIVNYDNSEVFADLLDFMYNGYVAPRETNFLQLLHLAVSFEIEMLKNYCEEFLRCNLHLGNFVSTYFLSRKYRLQGLEEFIVNFLQMNLSDAVKQGEFLTLNAVRFNTLLARGWMVQIKPEIKLFLIISWVGYDVQDRECYLVLLLRHIDWSSVASDFLLEISRTENFFTSHESSLYLLLQTLYSAGIPLGPYTEKFPLLRRAHQHILAQVVHTSLLPTDSDDYFQVTIQVIPRPEKKHASINTDVNSQHFIEHEAQLLGQESQEQTLNETHDEEANVNRGINKSIRDVADLNSESWTFERQSVAEPYVVEETKCSKRKGRPRKLNNEIELEKVPTAPPLLEESPEEMVVDKHVPKRKSSKSKRRKGRRKKVKKEIDISNENDSISVQVIHNKMTDIVEKDESQGMKEPKGVAELERGVETSDMQVEGDVIRDNTESTVEEEEQPSSDDETENVPKPRLTRLSTAHRRGRGRPPNSNKNGPLLDCHYPDCNYKTRMPRRLEKHLKWVHESDTKFKCNICPFESCSSREYSVHMREHFDGPPFKCDEPQCNFVTDRMQKFLVHRMVHSDERPFGCDQCGMRFRANNNLHAHLKTHTGTRNFVCDVCHKSFATKNTLMQHIVTHSDHRPYLCDTCGFSTKYQSHLIAHRRIHTGDVYHCQFPKCTYFTPKRSQLKSHMRSHLGIRSHICQVCGKSFVEKSHLVRHEKIHTQETPHHCSVCDYSTARSDKLKEHYQKHHTNDPNNTKTRTKQTQTRKGKSKKQDKLYNIDITAPMLVKWDHGGYSMQPNNEQSGLTDQYTVLRDHLTAPAQTFDGVAVTDQIVEHRMLVSGLDDSQVVHDVDGIGSQENRHPQTSITVLRQVTAPLTLVSNPSVVDGVQTVVVSQAGQDNLGTTPGDAHGYTIITQNTPASVALSQNHQDYGGLGAFMALF
ncbi:hypothetical protein ACJMK2_016712 [Sinanodonta woodiana]|uniref:Uncharacterized protein n=1 Tax=Sinanodonta woodiana TaxID=1069815 RepID=A0ABD3UUI8_SINWO